MPKKTLFEDYMSKELKEIVKTRKMQRELNKFGSKTPSGGMVWTVGDMQRFFNRRK